MESHECVALECGVTKLAESLVPLEEISKLHEGENFSLTDTPRLIMLFFSTRSCLTK